ncbi:MAG: plasmid stabilization protein [Solirubrobacterales bacterium]
MAAITVRDLDDDLKARLRVRAAEHGCSMEAEVRAILHRALEAPDIDEGIGLSIRRRFAEVGGVELVLPTRRAAPRAATLPK